MTIKKELLEELEDIEKTLSQMYEEGLITEKRFQRGIASVNAIKELISV